MSRAAKRKQGQQLGTRAGIYVRVSSERQGERVSPDTQEADARAYCEARGYQVLQVFRDVEKYRVGGRLVEPSGTRADRPGLRAMLTAARAGEIDRLIAWREDRLYRGYRPMLDVLECLDESGAQLELVKENFDATMAPIKAWAARQELEAKHDRMVMGVAGRLARGKAWNSTPAYGYQRGAEGAWVVEPTEAHWLAQIWAWYAEGVPTREIRRKLIAAGAPQKAMVHPHGRPQVTAWSPAVITRLLKYEPYHTGRREVTWDGQTYQLELPALVDAETAQVVASRRLARQEYPARNVKGDYLGMGVVYCHTCGVKMGLLTRHRRKGVELKHPDTVYRCNRLAKQERAPGCAGKMSQRKLDAELWRKVWEVISDPQRFEALLAARVAALKAQEGDARAESEQLQARLDELETQEQWVITQGRTRAITDRQMQLQLAALGIERLGVEHELSDKRLLVGDHSAQLVTLAQLYRQRVQRGAVRVNDTPTTPAQAAAQFKARRLYVEQLVTRARLMPDRELKVDMVLDYEKLLGDGLQFKDVFAG